MQEGAVNMDVREYYLNFFHQADTDGNGWLSLKELIAIMRKRGYTGTDDDITAIFHMMDTSGDNRVTLDEFMLAMGSLPPFLHKQAAMRSVFHYFDKDDSGYVDKAELKTTFAEMGKYFSDDEIQNMMDVFDMDGDGKCSYEEFVTKMFMEA